MLKVAITIGLFLIVFCIGIILFNLTVGIIAWRLGLEKTATQGIKKTFTKMGW